MKEMLKAYFILSAGIFLSAFPYLPVQANPTQTIQGVLRKKANAGGGGGLLADEQFETPGIEETWGGTWTNDQYATSPAPLVGSYSGRLTGTTEVEFDIGSLQTEIWVKFAIHVEGVIANSSTYHVLRIYDAAGTANGDVAGYVEGVWGSTGQFRRFRANHGYTVDSGTTGTGSIGSFEDDTTYWCWVQWKAETSGGAGDGVMNLWTHSSDAYASRTLICSTTDGGWDGAQRVAFRSGGGYDPVNLDGIQISNTDPQ